jgi:hypothetical protein
MEERLFLQRKASRIKQNKKYRIKISRIRKRKDVSAGAWEISLSVRFICEKTALPDAGDSDEILV